MWLDIFLKLLFLSGNLFGNNYLLSLFTSSSSSSSSSSSADSPPPYLLSGEKICPDIMFSKLRFCRTWVDFSRTLSDDRQLFAVLMF